MKFITDTRRAIAMREAHTANRLHQMACIVLLLAVVFFCAALSIVERKFAQDDVINQESLADAGLWIGQ